MFFVTEGLTVVYWGRASDKFGRKPILVAGLIGLAISMFSFGLAPSFSVLFLSRCFQGAFNGNIGVTKTVIAEIASPENMAQIFSFIPLMWGIGVTIG